MIFAILFAKWFTSYMYLDYKTAAFLSQLLLTLKVKFYILHVVFLIQVLKKQHIENKHHPKLFKPVILQLRQ